VEKRYKVSAVVILPTYNESGNIKLLIESILEIEKGIDILVVDDSSPDGTARIVERIAAQSRRVHILCREGRRGRGLAGIAGFIYAIKKGYDYIIEMDADFSHPAEYIPLFLKEIKKHDVVIGSRFIKGSVVTRSNLLRNIISAMANIYIRIVLGIRVRDCTSGFRCFKRNILDSIRLEDMISQGPSIVEEILYACHKRGYDIAEVPVTFKDRRHGKTKLTLGKLLKSSLLMIQIRLRKAA